MPASRSCSRDRQVGEQGLLVLQEIGHGGVDDRQPGRGELHQHAAAVVRRRTAAYEAPQFEPVDAVGHRAAGHQCLLHEGAR